MVLGPKRLRTTAVREACLGATDFALPAAIFCSLTSGVQKLEIFSYTKKFGLVMLTILAGGKNLLCHTETKTLNHL